MARPTARELRERHERLGSRRRALVKIYDTQGFAVAPASYPCQYGTRMIPSKITQPYPTMDRLPNPIEKFETDGLHYTKTPTGCVIEEAPHD